jgi:hypothetical protein
MKIALALAHACACMAASLLLVASACAAAPAASAPHGSPAASKYPEPVVHERITRDRAVSIHEQQVRGATTSIEVKPLHGGAPYHVVPPANAPGNDPAHMQGSAQWTIGVFK